MMRKETRLECTKGKIERMDVKTETGLHQGTRSALLFCDRTERGQGVDNQFELHIPWKEVREFLPHGFIAHRKEKAETFSESEVRK